MEPQPQLQREPQTEVYTDDTQKNKHPKKSDADCSHVADCAASVDEQRNNGWYTSRVKPEFLLTNALQTQILVVTRQHLECLKMTANSPLGVSFFFVAFF